MKKKESLFNEKDLFVPFTFAKYPNYNKKNAKGVKNNNKKSLKISKNNNKLPIGIGNNLNLNNN